MAFEKRVLVNFAEITIMKFAWLFQLDYSMTVLQVIWVLGVSMFFLAGIIHLPRKLTIALSLLVVFGHNYLDFYALKNPFGSGLWAFLHVRGLVDFGGLFGVAFIYPALPWIFVMALGYYFGELYRPSVLSSERTRKLLYIGFSTTLLFFVLRYINVYGNLEPWIAYESFSSTLMSFFDITKYPPSLLYLLITLGPSMVFLALVEKWQEHTWAAKLVTIGRVPMFFYIVHVYVIHLVALFAAKLTGFKFSDMIIDFFVVLQPELKGYGFNLWIVYLIWVLLIVGLYPLCQRYDRYKSNNRDKWWLCYL
ncbi:MAG: putative membrane protein [Arcticibacterium sp.]